MIKTNIKMRVTPEQSRRVQEICFKNGIYWGDKSKEVYIPQYDNEYLLIRGYITYHGLNSDCYFTHEEIDAKTNGTCEEAVILDRGAKSCDMLQSENNALKEENSNLQEQVKDYTLIKESSQTVFNKFNDKIVSLEQQVKNQMINMKEILKQLKEKDTIISYLESKLK